MIVESDAKILKNFLNLGPDPEETFTYNELTGYLFGLAMTPDIILPSEWVPLIFGGEMPAYDNLDQVDAMNSCLMQVFNNLTATFHNNKLAFPFDFEHLTGDELETIYEWVSGFEEALALRENIWDPEEQPDLFEHKKQELYHSLMTIQGLLDPDEVFEFFDNLPDEAFEEAFPGIDGNFEDRKQQIEMFLLASLPLSVQTLLEHAASLEKKRQARHIQKINPDTKKHPEGQLKVQKSRKNNVIKVDFSRPRK